MIVEIIGPPGAGKTSIINELKKEKDTFALVSEIKQNFSLFSLVINFAKAFIKYFLYFKFWNLKKYKINKYYFLNFIKKITYINLSKNLNKHLLLDEGPVYISISSEALLNQTYINSFDFIKKADYLIINLIVNSENNLSRLSTKQNSESWVYLDIEKDINRIVIDYKIAINNKLNPDFISEYGINYYEVENNYSIQEATKTILSKLK
tara:strand:- start:6112 stop:6735 length:624 start_codon:yes stop_codon:yes gene_type:complete